MVARTHHNSSSSSAEYSRPALPQVLHLIRHGEGFHNGKRKVGRDALGMAGWLKHACVTPCPAVSLPAPLQLLGAKTTITTSPGSLRMHT